MLCPHPEGPHFPHEIPCFTDCTGFNVSHTVHSEGIPSSARDEQDTNSLLLFELRVHAEVQQVVYGTVATDLHRLGVIVVLKRVPHTTRGHEEPIWECGAF